MIGLVAGLEVWALVAVNFSGVALGTIITGVSYVAYGSHDRDRALVNATIGFALITLGMTMEPLYQLGIRWSHVLASEQNVLLQILEGTVFALGFLILFLSTFRHAHRTERREIFVPGVDDELFEDPE
jgi:hypothetical protein